MIGIRQENELLDRIVRGLLHPESPVSYNLVVPPGFGEDHLAEALAAKLKSHAQKPLVAVLSADLIRSADTYARELIAQWNACGAGLPAAPTNSSLNRITQFFEMIPQGRPAIQILTRFHRILDVFEASFLGDLRDRERMSMVRSVCISPHGYDELRQRWRQRGHYFCNSDYGWSHHVELVEPMAIDDAVKSATSAGVPEFLAKFVAAWTGNYPEPFEWVINHWKRLGRPAPTNAVQADLRREAQKALRRFVKWIDPGETSIYRDAVLDLEINPDEQEAVLRLNGHPWKNILLNERGRIRADQLSAAIVTEYLHPEVRSGKHKVSDVELWTKGAALYRGWRFVLAQNLLATRCEAGGVPRYLTILRLHAQIMTEVYGGESESPMTDCDWEAACSALRKARDQIGDLRLDQEYSERLTGRYEEFFQFCSRVLEASRVNSRVVDVLLGIRGGTMDPDWRVALTLLVAHFAYDSRIPGDTLACQAALPLLEQVFRAWAYVCLDLNYYAAPTGYDDIWQQVSSFFDGALRRSEPNSEFPSFEAFAYFSIALHRSIHEDERDLRPEADLKALERSLSVLDLRRDLAHALAFANPRLRHSYFEVTNRWLDCLLRCDTSVVTREELLSVVEPLPLLGPDGQFR